jgi:hypothetical protein
MKYNLYRMALAHARAVRSAVDLLREIPKNRLVYFVGQHFGRGGVVAENS